MCNGQYNKSGLEAPSTTAPATAALHTPASTYVAVVSQTRSTNSNFIVDITSGDDSNHYPISCFRLSILENYSIRRVAASLSVLLLVLLHCSFLAFGLRDNNILLHQYKRTSEHSMRVDTHCSALTARCVKSIEPGKSVIFMVSYNRSVSFHILPTFINKLLHGPW